MTYTSSPTVVQAAREVRVGLVVMVGTGSRKPRDTMDWKAPPEEPEGLPVPVEPAAKGGRFTSASFQQTMRRRFGSKQTVAPPGQPVRAVMGVKWAALELTLLRVLPARPALQAPPAPWGRPMPPRWRLPNTGRVPRPCWAST